MKRGTKHSTESGDGSQGGGELGFAEKAPASEGGRYKGKRWPFNRTRGRLTLRLQRVRGHLKVAATGVD